MFAIRAGPEQAHWLASGYCHGVNLKHIADKVASLWVVSLVQRHGFGVVVDGNVHSAADGLLNASAGTAAAGKEVYHQLCVDRQVELGG